MKPNRDSVRLGMLDALSQRIFLTIGMLIGGTPIVVYGDELGVKQVDQSEKACFNKFLWDLYL